jgi:hypothetical protein
VKNARACVTPNAGFVKQLKFYEVQLQNKGESKISLIAGNEKNILKNVRKIEKIDFL